MAYSRAAYQAPTDISPFERTPRSSAPLATEKQVAFIDRLAAERGVEVDTAGITRSAASAEIDRLMAMPRPVDPNAPRPIDEDGFYVLRAKGPDAATQRDPVRVFKVQRAVHGSGNLYAKELIFDEDGGRGTWEYMGRKPLYLALEKLTLELAKELGHLYGICCVCGATLTNEKSIEAGIGPVCGGRLG